VGRPVVRQLLKTKYNLLILSRNPKNAAKLFPRSGRLKFLRGDIFNVKIWSSRLKKFRPDVAIHMAWEGIPDYGPKISAKNLNGSIEVLRALGESGCKKIIATGSSWEYGAASAKKFREDSAPKPLNAFSGAKTKLHFVGKEIAKRYGAKFIWARLFFVYGPSQKSSSLIPSLISMKKNGISLRLNNPYGGNDFIHVEDAARAVVKIARVGLKNSYTVYNVGTGIMTSNARVANLVFGKKLLPEPKKPIGFWADISKIKKEIGWKPKTGIEAGIKDMLSKR